MTLDPTAYAERRETIRTYFDRTALDAWKQFATDTPLGRIRETVRQGRESMRAALIGRLPADLSGWRILDAGCGAGHLSVALANRGADVVGVDLAPEMIAHAEEHLPEITGSGSVHLIAGDMLTAADGRFDAIVAMDSVIHYAPEMAARAVAHLVSKADRQVVFSVAPSTPALLVKRASAKLFPKPDRAPLIEPVRPSWLTRRLDDHTGADGWQAAIGPRISTGFYTSQVMEVRRHG